MTVDPTTLRIFVTHNNAVGNVAVIDGTTNQRIGDLISLGGNLSGIAVNSTTRRVYVVRGNRILILDADNPHAPLPSREIILEDSISIDRIAVDSVTNRIFVPAKHSNDSPTTHRLYVIDGNANTWTKVLYEHQLLANCQPRDIAIDWLHKRFYISNFGNATNSLSVLNLDSLKLVTALPVPGALAASVAVDPVTSLAYVATSKESHLASRGIGMAVFDTSNANPFTPATAGLQPPLKADEGKSWGIAIAPDSRRVYLVNSEDRSVSVVQVARMPGTTDPAQRQQRARARLELSLQGLDAPNSLLPLVIHTLARGLQNVQDKGELDHAFDTMIRSRSGVSRERLGQFVADYRAMPELVRTRVEPEIVRNLDVRQPIQRTVLEGLQLQFGRIGTIPQFFILPEITSIEPTWARKGQSITINGKGFTADSSVEFKGIDPDWDFPIASVKPLTVTSTRLTVQLPPAVDDRTRYLFVRCTVAGMLKESNKFEFSAHDTPMPPPPPPPRPRPMISSIGGQRYPGKDILIIGVNLKPTTQVILQALDPLMGVNTIFLEGKSIIGSSVDGSSLQVRIPITLPPGPYRVFVRLEKFAVFNPETNESNWAECQIQPYRYRVTFTNFQCVSPFGVLDGPFDGFDTDRLITMWAVTQDGLGYFKSTSAIQTDRGQTHAYGGQGLLFPADGGEGKAINRVLGIQNQLFFGTEDYDPQSTIQTIGAVGDLVVLGATAAAQPEIAALAAVLVPVMQALISWLSEPSDPGLLWPFAETIGWSVVDLQKKTNNPQRVFDGQVEFYKGDGWGMPHYILHYQIARIE